MFGSGEGVDQPKIGGPKLFRGGVPQLTGFPSFTLLFTGFLSFTLLLKDIPIFCSSNGRKLTLFINLLLEKGSISKWPILHCRFGQQVNEPKLSFSEPTAPTLLVFALSLMMDDD